MGAIYSFPSALSQGYSARYSSGESGPQCPYRHMLTKTPLLHAYVPSSASEKHQDTVTSNEQRTSHPIGYPVYPQSGPAREHRHKISCLKRGNMKVSPPPQIIRRCAFGGGESRFCELHETPSPRLKTRCVRACTEGEGYAVYWAKSTGRVTAAAFQEEEKGAASVCVGSLGGGSC